MKVKRVRYISEPMPVMFDLEDMKYKGVWVVLDNENYGNDYMVKSELNASGFWFVEKKAFEVLPEYNIELSEDLFEL